MNKKTYLIILYTVTILIILGTVGYRFSKWTSKFWDHFGNWEWTISGDTTTESWDVANFDSIDADLSVASVEIVYGSKNQVEFRGTEAIIPEVTVSNNVLKIKQPKKTKVIGNTNGALIITVSEKNLKELSLSSNVGDISIEDSNFTFDRIDITTNVGELELKDITVTGRTKINTDVGEVYIKNCDLHDTTIITNVGAVTVRDSFKSDYSFNLRTDVGDISCFGNKGHDHRYEKSGSGADIKITTDVGEISIN